MRGLLGAALLLWWSKGASLNDSWLQWLLRLDSKVVSSEASLDSFDGGKSIQCRIWSHLGCSQVELVEGIATGGLLNSFVEYLLDEGRCHFIAKVAHEVKGKAIQSIA